MVAERTSQWKVLVQEGRQRGNSLPPRSHLAAPCERSQIIERAAIAARSFDGVVASFTTRREGDEGINEITGALAKGDRGETTPLPMAGKFREANGGREKRDGTCVGGFASRYEEIAKNVEM